MKYKPLAILVFLILSQCGENPAPAPLTVDIAINLYDSGNNNNASDLGVSYSLSSVAGIKELGLVIVNAANSSSLNANFAKTLAPLSFQSITSNTNDQLSLREEMTDVDAKPITNGSEYVAYMIVVPENGQLQLSGPSNSVKLLNQGILSGDWTGTFTDSLFPSGIRTSARMESVDGTNYTGKFYSPAYCCAGPDIGTFSFVTSANDDIADFVYYEYLENYKGPGIWCTGVYKGAGAINGKVKNTIVLNYIADDCDGHHTRGKIALTKK